MDSVDSVRAFLQAVEWFTKESTRDDPSQDCVTLFRGQRMGSAEWPARAKIARSPFTPEAICCDPRDRSAERSLLQLFRDYTSGREPNWVHGESPQESGWRYLILAQHHGLPTRLLDWSANALVGLFFAVEHDADCACDAAVLVLQPHNIFSVGALSARNADVPIYRQPPDSVRPNALRPPQFHPRIISQDSYFTIQVDPQMPIVPDLEIGISREAFGNIRRELEQLGVHARSMYADLDSIAKWLAADCRRWKPNRGVQRDS